MGLAAVFALVPFAARPALFVTAYVSGWGEAIPFATAARVSRETTRYLTNDVPVLSLPLVVFLLLYSFDCLNVLQGCASLAVPFAVPRLLNTPNPPPSPRSHRSSPGSNF
jgi:hypothetical protein